MFSKFYLTALKKNIFVYFYLPTFDLNSTPEDRIKCAFQLDKNNYSMK